MIRGDHTFSGQTEFFGMIGGNAVIAAGATVVFRGMVNGNLVVEKGGEVFLLGMVNGMVIDQGGTIHFPE
ncbi:hypothetical protein [Celeribacter baekdonensis]|uniref:hypothetical protein n=1 Tax=Celeribacter baekdonensis TaxID=875171 RepID=UPI003A8EAD4A